MKKRIIKILVRWGWLQAPLDNNDELHLKLIVLRGNISRCQSYDELLSCEKMFHWYVDKYITSSELSEFKKEILMHLQNQRVLIQISTSQLYGYGNTI